MTPCPNFGVTRWRATVALETGITSSNRTAQKRCLLVPTSESLVGERGPQSRQASPRRRIVPTGGTIRGRSPTESRRREGGGGWWGLDPNGTEWSRFGSSLEFGFGFGGEITLHNYGLRLLPVPRGALWSGTTGNADVRTHNCPRNLGLFPSVLLCFDCRCQVRIVT